MLENRKNVRKILNILVILLATIMILCACPLPITAIDLEQGTINPIYKPEWEKVSSTIDRTNKRLTVTVKGSAYKSQTINSDVTIDYGSDVTSTLAKEDITVFIDGVEVTSTTNPEVIVNPGTESTNATSHKTEITHTIVLSNLEEAYRQTDPALPYKEWSGNIRIKIAGRGKDSDTYDENVLVDDYGNQNMMETDQGQPVDTWIDVDFGDTETNANTDGTMFADFVKPEFTYKSSDTTIGSGTAGNKKVSVIFDITDKYFDSASINKDHITVSISDYTDAEVQAAVEKVLTKTHDIIRKANGTISYEEYVAGSEYVLQTGETKIGERYELVISKLEQLPNDGFKYSGYMNLTFESKVAKDKSGNESPATTIAIGLDDNDGNAQTNPGTGVVVDVVDPVWKTENLTIGQDANGITSATVDLIATDKYFKQSTLTKQQIQVLVAGRDISTEATELVTNLSTPTNVTNGQKYSFSLSNLEESYATFITEFNKWHANASTGRPYREYSGPTQIYIPAETIEDNSTNKSKEVTIDLGNIDTLKPEIIKISAENDTSAKTQTIVFVATDKYFDPANLLEESEIVVKVNGETASSIAKPITAEAIEANKNKIFKDLTSTPITYDVDRDGTAESDEIVGYTYTLVLSNFEQTEKLEGKSFYEWSGNVSIDITAGAVEDKNRNGNALTTIDGKFADYIAPKVELVSATNNADKTQTIVFTATDKYFDITNVLQDAEITVKVNGEIADSIAKPATVEEIEANKNKIFKDLTSSAITYDVDRDGTVESNEIVGYTYTLILSNFEQTEKIAGKPFYEWSGNVTIDIAEGAVIDKGPNGDANGDPTKANKNAATTLNGKFADFIAPKIELVSATNNADKTQTIVFTATDKYLYTTNELQDSEIIVKIDNEIPTGITKSLTSSPITYDVDRNGTVESDEIVGYTYTLVIGNFEQARTSAVYGEYIDYSGSVTIDVVEGALIDNGPDGAANGDATKANKNALKTLNGKFADFIKPNVTYKYSESAQGDPGDINYEGKTFTMVFEITDKYFENSTLTIDDLTILIDGETPDWREAGETVGVTKNLTITDVEDTFNKTVGGTVVNDEYVIGKRYTLVLSNLEQLQIQSGEQYLDYSGIITVGIPAGVLDGTGTLTEGVNDTSDNLNDATTISSGMDIPGGAVGDKEVVDVVDPLWEKVEASANAIDPANPTSSTATIKIKGTDKYYASTVANLADKITVWAQSGTEGAAATNVTGSVNVNIDEVEPIYKVGTDDHKVGEEYTITITGFAQDVNQIKIRIAADAMLDTSGNGNKTTEMIVYNVLRLTSTESAGTSGFLDKNSATGIARQDIEKVIFTSSMSGATAVSVKKVWDVSAAEDGSIKAWTAQTSAPYTVYIGSDDEIYANQDSSYLFSYIGYGESCTATAEELAQVAAGNDIHAVEYLELLNTSSVTNMEYMFNYFGYRKMTTLNLGTFDTTYVTDMEGMFNECGKTLMTTLNLGTGFKTNNVTDMSHMFALTGADAMTIFSFGNNFNTTNVTSMAYMFSGFGYTAMTSLTLPSGFNTGNVTDMTGMFNHCGFTAMQSLNLGSSFDTINVEDMSDMFYSCGEKELLNLDLGANFNTINVENMSNMFNQCGQEKMQSLNLGSNFNTSNVTNMANMFELCGALEMTSLDLGDKFDTKNVTDMTAMFKNTGYNAMTVLDLGPLFTKIASTNTEFATDTGKPGVCTIYAPESIYSSKNAFKLNSTSTTTINYTTGTINPIYRPEWTKVSSTIDIDETNLEDSTISIVLKGNANKNQTIGNAKINYSSNVTSALTKDDIKVYINGVEASWITKELPAASPATAAEVTQTLTLSGFEETTRRTGVPYKEWSGNISIRIGGRGQATSTYTANKLKDTYGNQSMMATDQTGTWIDVTYGDTETDRNTNGTMFTDFVHPEFTYKSAETIIGNGNNGNTKKVTVAFDVTDKYFNGTTLTANDITINLIDTNPETTIDPAHITKTLTKTHDIIRKANGTISYEQYVEGSEYELQTGELKVGEKYELLVEGLEQRDEDGFSDGYTYSGPMSISFPAGKVTDKSGNINNATTITIGVDEPARGEGYASPSEIFDADGTNANGLHIGDFVNYDAGIWTQDEINAIQTGLKTDLKTATGSTSAPNSGYQFGGFAENSNRNGNTASGSQIKDVSTGENITGWRVFDIDGDNITLISAGTPELYYHPNLTNSNIMSDYVLTGEVSDLWSEEEANNYQVRNWDNYVNKMQKAESATVLTEAELISWYNKYITTESQTTPSNINSEFQKIYEEPYIKYQNMIDNYSRYWISEADDYSLMGFINAKERGRRSLNNTSNGLRILVNLSSEVLLEKNGTKTLTGGNMDAYGGNQTYNCWEIKQEAQIVDVVDPIWELVGSDIDTGAIVLRTKDKYFADSTLDEDDITVIVNGVASNLVGKTLNGPTYKKLDASGNYITTTKEEATAAEYSLQLSNITLDTGEYIEFIPTNVDDLVGDTAKYKAENGGHVELQIAAGTSLDESGNGNKVTNFEVGVMDSTSPEVYKIQATHDEDAESVTIVFNVTDRNYHPEDLIEVEDDEISLWIDGTEVEGINISSFTSKEIKAAVDNTEKVLGHQYTLVLDSFAETVAEFIASSRKYKELSGTLEVKIDSDASRDINGNTLNPETTTISEFVDFIEPEVIYKYTESSQETPGDINYQTKTFTMVFDIIDKYFNESTLATELTNATTDAQKQAVIDEYLTILIDGELPGDKDGDGVLSGTEKSPITKSLTVEDVKETFTKTVGGAFVNDEYVIGKRFTLVLSNLEQIQIRDGKEYLDYSGVITVAVKEDAATDTKTNGNVPTTITSGIDIPGGAVGDSEIIDVVDPIWEKVSSSASAINPADPTTSTATIKIKGTDKYYASSTLTDKIKVYAHSGETPGTEVTDITEGIEIDVGEATDVFETANAENQIGDEYTITITGFEQDVNQIKIEILEDAMLDESGNGNKVTQFLVYNTLKLTSSETSATSAFLGQSTGTTLYPKNTTITPIARQDIEKVIFVDSLENVIDGEAPRIWDTTEKTWTFKSGIQRVWDVSATGDDSILAWVMKNDDGTDATAPYTVYIGSNDEIFANQNSSYLFAYIGYGESCTATAEELAGVAAGNEIYAVEGLELLNENSVTNMSGMFGGFGYRKMTTLDLGMFNTTYVTDMSWMFWKCGDKALTALDLSSGTGEDNTTQFNTGNVTDMSYMFNYCGNSVLAALNLGHNFDTRNVTTMDSMFNGCGGAENANRDQTLTALDLGEKFNTSNVTNMRYMFGGLRSIETLSLGGQFYTNEVTNMGEMFRGFGSNASGTLDLGEYFDTSNVTNMSQMFYQFGMANLNLGNKFNTSKVTNMSYMFAENGNYLTSLDLGDLFYTTSVTDMFGMFSLLGSSSLTSLDLGPAFTKIMDAKVFNGTGKSGECTIYAPESIYKNKNAFKLNSADTTETTTGLQYTRGTINPIYRPEWTKVGATIDKGGKTLTVTVKGSAYKTQTVEVEVDNGDGTTTTTQVEQPIYASNVTSTLAKEDIKVFIDGVEVTSTTNPQIVVDTGEESTNAASTKTEITHTIVLSSLEEAYRQTSPAIPYKEWSGNVSIKILGRGKESSTYSANVLKDIYGNQSMMESDQDGTNADGTWIDVRFEDDEKDKITAIDATVTEITATTPVYMFADFIKPEFTYKFTDTTIGNGTEGNKKVTVVFDVLDKYFSSTDLATDANAELITVQISDYTDEEVNNNITKSLKLKQNTAEGAQDEVVGDVTYKTNGDILYKGKKVGERYELELSQIEQTPYDGFKFSGTMNLSFPTGIIKDTSGNTNNAKTITIGIDEPDGTGSAEIVDVVDPIIYYNSSSINRGDKTVTLTVKIEDKYLESLSATELQTLRDTLHNVVTVNIEDENGNAIDSSGVQKEISRTFYQAQYMIFSIKLSNFGVYEGKTSVTIPENMWFDTSGNGNKETTILVGDTNDVTSFKDSIVDFTKPTWEYVTSSIQRDRPGETGTVTLEIKGTDIYFDEAYFSDVANQLDLSAVKVYVNGVENTTITKTFAKNEDETIKKEYIEESKELATGYSRVMKGVKYTLILGNFGTNEGTVRIDVPENAIRDTALLGNILTPIDVGNPQWIETDVEDANVDINNPKYTAFRNDIVDYIKPVIKYQFVQDVNPKLDRTHETVEITFTTTDTNFLESNIGLEDMKIFIDDMQVYGTGATEGTTITPRIESEALPAADGNGLKYTLTLSALELNRYLTGDIFERHSGVIKIVIAKDQVEDSSGNKNIETTIIVDNGDGDDQANGQIVDFVNPNIYYLNKYVNWQERYALITLRATDRFYDLTTKLQPSNLTFYELNENGQYIQITSIAQDDVTITPKENGYGYDFIIRIDNFDEEFKMKIGIPAGILKDSSGNYNDAYLIDDNTAIGVDIDNRRPSWKYVSTDTTNFESSGKIIFNVKGQDKFLDLANSNLVTSNLVILKDGEIYLDGADSEDAAKIEVTYKGTNTAAETDLERYEAYEIVVNGLTEVGTYSLVFAKDTLVDEFANKSAATTISFSKSAIASNTGNYTNVTYHVTPDQESIHSSYVHELMSVNTTGTNFENTTYRPSTLGEIHNNGKNPLFAEPMYKPSISGYDVSSVYAPVSFAGWAEADADGNPIYYTDSTLTTVSEEETQYMRIYGLYDEIPNTITNLKAIWQDATVVFVSSEGSNSNDGKLPTTPVANLQTAYSKLNSSGTAENNIIVIMDAVEFESATSLSGNATITSLYAGVDYRNEDSAELKISSNMIIDGDVIFDNIKLYASNTTVSAGTDYLGKGDYSNMLISNYSGDITLGRGITTPSGYYTFGAIIGGNYKTETSTGELGTHIIRVEAGRYNNIIAGSTLSTSTTTSKSVTHEIVIGNMRDTAVSRNSKLTITGYLAIGENEQKCYPSNGTTTQNSASKTYADVTLYSGTFTAINKFAKATENAAIYLRSINGQTDGLMNFQMFGGDVDANIYAGARISSMYESDNFNTMKFYGGEVTGNIFGQGGNDSFTGSTTITVEGRFSMTGNIFGGSNVTSAIENSVGSGDSVITINSSSVTITGNIYGGANASAGSTSFVTGKTSITLKAGTVSNIYGSGYNCGNTGNTNIAINNGTVSGKIFGGAHQNQARGTSTITVIGGTVQGNIYGGNENIESQLEGDTIYQYVNITIGDTDPTTTTIPTVNGIIYGGGQYDNVEKATIKLIESTNATSVYGGSDTNATTITSEIYLQGMTVNQIYGGGHGAGLVAESYIYLQSGTATEVYGGGYNAVVTNSKVSLGDENTLEGTATVTTIYGGSNTSGTVTQANVTLTSGTLTNVFGGGDSATVGNTQVLLNGITIDTIHGGSKGAGVTEQAGVALITGTVNNVFGGGLDGGATKTVVLQGGGTVKNIYGGNNSTESGTGGETGTSNIEIFGSTVENIYGGNYLKGTTQKSYITIHGDSETTVTGNIFGGGYKSNIGTAENPGSTSINIAKGTIYGDINGGSEQGIVYGTTNINIGFEVLDTNAYTIDGTSSDWAGNINIIGTIYGAGSTETAGELTVVGDTNITLDNSTTSPITYFTAEDEEKSIYGSGKGGAIYSNGTTTDKSTIHLKDFGTADDIYTFKSIEDTGNLYIGNSVIELSAGRDTNTRYYTLNRITNALTVYGGTTLYTQRGFNKVGGFNSYVNKTSTRQTVEISGTEVTTNVDNRLYTLEGVNLIFAKQEVTRANKSGIAKDKWGEVNGMAFFGMYKFDAAGNKQYDIYAPGFNYETGTTTNLFNIGTYIEGQHKSSHNIQKDGFYTNVAQAGSVTPQVITTIDYTNYYDWVINAPVVNYEVDLIASTFGEKSVAEVLIDYQYEKGNVYTLSSSSVSLNALRPGVNLVDPTDSTKLPMISTNANNTFGLTMGTTNSGWLNSALTNIYTADNGSLDGDTEYQSDTSTTAGTLQFKVYNSINITEDQDLGSVNLILMGEKPTGGVFQVVIAVNLQSEAEELKEQYTPRFTDKVGTEFSYTSDSRVDLTYLLYNTYETTPYETGDYRVISTSEQLPAGTTIKMKDYGLGDTVNKLYYYHVTATTPYETETVEGVTRYIYKLSNFMEMGSEDVDSVYPDDNSKYFHTGVGTEGYALEKYDISIDFLNSNINTNKLAQETYLELRSSTGTVKYNNGDKRIKYNLYSGKNALYTEEIISNAGSSYSVVDDLEIPFTLTTSLLEQDGIMDTKYYDQIAGIAIQIVDGGGTRIKSPAVQNFKLINANDATEVYEADSNGVIRVPMIEGLGSKLGDYKLTMTQSSVPHGIYKVQVRFYTADDGKYFGTVPIVQKEFKVTFISKQLGQIGIEATEDSRVINKSTGLNLSGTSGIDMTVKVGDPVQTTNVRVELYKRNATYTTVDEVNTYSGITYTAVDIKDYLQGTWETPETYGLTSAAGSKEYIVLPTQTYETPVSLKTIEFDKAVVSGISTGEYKLVFKVYNNNTLVQELKKTFIVTP